jgi:glycosyltransferase involved in cell wall biosynthesis
MRILIPILGFGPHGGHRVLSKLASAWNSMGHECTFLAPSTTSEPYFPTNAQILRCDRHGHFMTGRTDTKATGYDNVASLFAGLNKIGRDYDVVLANHCLTAWPVRWSNTGNAKLFYYVQASERGYYPFFKHPIKHLLARGSYFLKLKQISNSAAYDDLGLRPLDTISPGIDLSVFTLKSNPGGFATKDQIVLGTIGRTEPHKGTATVLSAYRRLRHEDPRVRMNVGFGNVATDDDLTITNIENDLGLAEYYRSVDIIVVACTGQIGAPHYPLIEAMASGTPVVHTGYYPGSSTNSWPTTAQSEQAVLLALRQVIAASDEERRIKAEAARRVVVSELEWDAVSDRFISHFEA